MSVKVTIKLYNDKLNQILAAHKMATEMTGEEVRTDIVTSAVVPKDTGNLEESSFVDTTDVDKGKVSIIFDTPYARRLYWHPEYNFRTDKNVNAKGKWMQEYIDGTKKDYAKDVYKNFLKNNSKGVIK